MKPFEYYLNSKDVRRTGKNLVLAKSLINDIKTRLKENWNEDEEKRPKTIFENIYDALRNFCDALLIKDGFKSYSHEASISYLSKYNFSIAEISELDKFRFIRNGSKYYGRIIMPEDVKNIKEFYLKIKEKINKLVRDNNLE